MKRLGRVIGGLFAVALIFASMQAVAETQSGGRDFNHMTTGFPLSGGHAAAACETCHMGGVFKGTPRTCDACHAVGRRIVATPKSNSHIITDAPCESCHFNTATWLGARFNHGTVAPGQCASCHNGRISTGKNSAHIATTYSCDKCHRSSAWLPASWNHTGVTGDCVTCHNAAGPGRNYSAATHMSQTTMTAMGITTCGACHKNYYSFNSAYYDHAGASTSCGTCHENKPAYVGVKQKPASAIHNSATTMGLNNCQACHRNYTSFTTGATFDHSGAGASSSCGTCHATPVYAGVAHTTSSIHTGLTAMGLTSCQACHKNYSSFVGATFDHSGAGAATTCGTCHGISPVYAGVVHAINTIHNVTTAMGLTSCQSCHKNTSSFAGAVFDHNTASACATCHSGAYTTGGKILGKPSGHIATINACSDCHTSKTTWLGALGAMPSGHIPFNTGVSCSSCHSGTAKVNINTLHTYSSSNTCAVCHISPNAYQSNNQQTKKSHKGSAGSNCMSCHKRAGTYQDWSE